MTVNLKDSKNYAIAMVVLVAVTVLVGGAFHQQVKKMAGVMMFRSAVYTTNIQEGYETALKAARTGKASAYYRSISNLVRQQAITWAANNDVENDSEARSQLEFLLGQTLTFADEATKINPYDYRNWMTLGDTYTTLNNYDVSGAYLDARTAYEKALERNPRAHDVLSRIAVLEIGENNLNEASLITNDMIIRRPNDSQALVLGAQVAYLDERESTGDAYLSEAARSANGNFEVMMQIGVFAYNQGRNEIAKAIFQNALALNPNSLDAALGLAYAAEANGDTEQSEAIINTLVESGRLQRNEDGTAVAPPEEIPPIEVIEDPQIGETIETDEAIDIDEELAEPVEVSTEEEG